MCDETSIDIGEQLPDDAVIYRACIKKGYISENGVEVEPLAFQKQGKNHKDGLSCAASPEVAAKFFPKNKGIIRISVAAIRAIERDLEICFDATDPNHILIRRLPCMDREDDERELAEAVSNELAKRAEIESTINVPPPE